MILNEPETSLHPDLLPALARLVNAAAAHTQLVVVTHAAALISALAATTDADTTPIVLEKELGETMVRDDQKPAWAWPIR